MTRLRVQGTGTTLEDALEDVRAQATELAAEQGQVLPERLEESAISYRVSVRRIGGGAYVSGRIQANVQDGFADAMERAGWVFDPDKHRVRVAAEYDLRKARGQPSGADAYQKSSGTLTGGYF